MKKKKNDICFVNDKFTPLPTDRTTESDPFELMPGFSLFFGYCALLEDDKDEMS